MNFFKYLYTIITDVTIFFGHTKIYEMIKDGLQK